MGLNEYDAVVNGRRTTLLLNDAEAKRRGLSLAEHAAPANKSDKAPADKRSAKGVRGRANKSDKAPANKAAPSAAPSEVSSDSAPAGLVPNLDGNGDDGDDSAAR